MAFVGLLLLVWAGDVLAQGNDKQFVIKKTIYKQEGNGYVIDDTDHYLAHVKVGDQWVLQDATEFSPNCLWYSGREFNLMGTNHNYYFVDDANRLRFLSAPLRSDGTLTLSDSKPPVYLLNNTDHNYYFYDWDYDNWPEGAGLARGHQHNGILSEDDCEYSWGDNQCWEVYWVEFDGSGWKLSTETSYGITDDAGRFRLVEDTPYDMQVTSSTNVGLGSLSDFEMEYQTNHSLNALDVISYPFNYIPAYHQYVFDEVTHDPESPIETHTYYYPYGADGNTYPPTSAQAVSSGSNTAQWTYEWSLSGEGAEFLSFSNVEASHTSSSSTPTLYYLDENTTGHKTATLTLTVIYSGESMQTTSCTVTVKTPCQNPDFSANVTYEEVIVSWTPTADSYTVSWKKTSDLEWTSASVDDVTSYPITGLDYATAYDYKVKASCSPSTSDPESGQFTTLSQPQALVYGCVFGGGRMADVGGNTEVVIINTDSIIAVYGGNDIAGKVLGANGSAITIGVNAGDANANEYNNGAASSNIRLGDVYGGGNGYYLYDAASFVGATTPDVMLENNHSVTDLQGNTVWKNETGEDYDLTIPTIVKTSITVNTNAVKMDSVFGGAKNAFVTNTDASADGTSIAINGGTAFAVFGGNNYGGTQTNGKHHIAITGTTTNTSSSAGLGRDFGIGYVFGGGNRVEGLTTDIVITGGQCDTVFGGGNAASVVAANVQINCEGPGKTITNAVGSWNGNDINEIEEGYLWDGFGVYNVHTLFGGNNRADMNGLPTLTLTAGSVGTVYGGGNSGQMLAQTPEAAGNPIASDFGSNYVGTTALPIYYGTHVVLESANMLVDCLYGGCQMSNVAYSTWVEVKDGHVGTVYGGCNIGGDVGSTCLYDSGDLTNEQKQAVQGATYVKASGGTIHGNLFAGANGYYHCNDGIQYVEGLDFSPGHSYIGKNIPSHNETHVRVSGDVTVKGNVYAGGNLAYVGFINETIEGHSYPTFRGFASVNMDGGTVEGSVFGGGNRASIFGSNEVKVSGGSIGYADGVLGDGALYGGNDRSGQVAQITNRVFPSMNDYNVASDGATSLTLLGVKTYVGITGKPLIGTVYGGGNGDYDYSSGYCEETDQPVQSNTFVDINIDAEPDEGEERGGYINMVYGGGNGVTVLDRITVFVNVENAPTGDNAYDQIGTIFGGNNKGDLDILSDVLLLHGQVNTIYGGCNEGRMVGSLTYNDSTNLSSMVHVRNHYQPNGVGESVATDAKVTGYIFGGCKKADVTNNTYVFVEGGENTATIFGGCNESGTVGGVTQVVVMSDDNVVTTGSVFGGGKGSQTAVEGKAFVHISGENTTVNGDVFGGGDQGVVNGGTEVKIGER